MSHPAAQLRIARPTDRLQELVRFYRDGLGFEVLGKFEGHSGYDGVMLGVRGAPWHLEFTHHLDGSPCPAPTRDNLLVLYIPERGALEAIAGRLERMGYSAVPPENPYWASRGLTFEDPDAWRVVLYEGTWMSP